MKKIIIQSLIAFFLITVICPAKAQELYKKKGYTLTFQSNDGELDSAVKNRMIATFFTVYPKLAKAFNRHTLKSVVFFVDTAYKGVAATSSGQVVFSAGWIKKHPEDIDVITHEVMHIVQNYGNSVGPGWLTEGIADYARYKFGVDNAGAHWIMPDLKPTHHFTNSYRITARFFAWLEIQRPGVIGKVDATLRKHTYTEDTWVKLTGKSLNELWEQYTQHPSIN